MFAWVKAAASSLWPVATNVSCRQLVGHIRDQIVQDLQPQIHEYEGKFEANLHELSVQLSQLDLESKVGDEAQGSDQKRQEEHPDRAAVEAEMQSLQASHEAFMFVVKLLHVSCPLLKQPKRAKATSPGFASRLRASTGSAAAASSASNAAVAAAAAAQTSAAEWGAREVTDLDLLDDSGELLQLLAPENRDRRASELLQQGCVYTLASSSASAAGESPPDGVPAAVPVGPPAVGAGRAKTPPKGAKKGVKGGKPSPKSTTSHIDEETSVVSYTPLLFTVPWSDAAAAEAAAAAAASTPRSSKKGGSKAKGKAKK